MNKKWRILIPTLIVGVLLASLGIGLAFAQEPNPPTPPTDEAYGYCPGHTQWCQQRWYSQNTSSWAHSWAHCGGWVR